MINWARVAELYDDFGDEGFAEIVEVFLSEVADGLERLHAAQTSNDQRAEFHFLKGAALNLGFVEMAAACSDGEARAAEAVDASDAKAQVLADMPAACDALARDWRDKLAGTE